MAELSNSLPLRYLFVMICPQPQRRKLHWFGLFRVRSPLLTESNFFLFLRVLRCFSSPGSPRNTIYSYCDTVTLLTVSSLIRTSAALCSFAAPRGFSQLVTSFFGAMYLGILLYALCSLIFLFRLRGAYAPQLRRISFLILR